MKIQVLKYQDNAAALRVDSNITVTINGVEASSLYLLTGMEAAVAVQTDAPGSFAWSYEEDSAAPEYTTVDRGVTFIMPGEDVSAALIWTCGVCADEDSDHWCDLCGERVSECADEDGDHWCDICWEHISALCADMDGDHSCDTCGNYIRALCADETGDHVCDTCESYLADLCVDEDEDHACEVCGNLVTCAARAFILPQGS